MRVKVGNNWYDSDVQPVLIKLSAEEKRTLLELDGEEVSMCVFPDGTPQETVRAFMGELQNSTFKLHQLKGD